jgi:transcriptional regulator with XRE-family HTH domain
MSEPAQSSASCRGNSPSNRPFGWARVVDLHRSQNLGGEVGGSGGVAGPAADHERPVGVATSAHFLDMVGGEVGGLVGGLASPPGAPVPHHGAVVGDHAATALAFLGVVVEVWSPGAAEDYEQEQVAARMRDLGHNWTQQTVSEVERGRRRVTTTELFSLTLVLGASIGDLFDPLGRLIAADAQARVRLDLKDLEALVCGHRRRARVEWGGEKWTELVGVEFKDVDQ